MTEMLHSLGTARQCGAYYMVLTRDGMSGYSPIAPRWRAGILRPECRRAFELASVLRQGRGWRPGMHAPRRLRMPHSPMATKHKRPTPGQWRGVGMRGHGGVPAPAHILPLAYLRAALAFTGPWPMGTQGPFTPGAETKWRAGF